MPKVNWNKGGKIKQCMDGHNTQKEYTRKMWTIKWATNGLRQLGLSTKQRAFYRCCKRPGHQDQLLSRQDPKGCYRPNVQDLWSISGNYWPYCGRVPWDGQNWILTQIDIPALEHLQIDEYKRKREMVRASAPNSNIKRQYHNLTRYANKDGSRDKGQQTRHCNQEQTGKKLPAYWYVNTHWKEHFK